MQCLVTYYHDPYTDDVLYTEWQDVTPVCGEDFCDRCGDCLACYGGDKCIDGHEHVFVRYVEYLWPLGNVISAD